MHFPRQTSGLSLILALCLLTLFLSGCSSLPAEHTIIREKDGRIQIPVKDVNDGKVHFFTYKKSGERINFFVRTDGKGELSTYFDACLTCHKHKKGYREEGTDLVCNECSMRFGLADQKWDNTAGCSPIMLKSSISNGQIIINKEHLEKGIRLFS
ncbi:MAG: Fe-S-containing protein [Thermodesulfovibrionales bacterium]